MYQVPREEVISQSVNAGMEPDTVQLLEVDKNILLVVERITRDLISRGEVTENENANKYSELSDDDMINGQQEVSITVKVGNIACKENYFCRPMCQRIYFLACLSKTPTPGTYALLLYCCPFFKKDELEKKLSKYIIPYRGEGEPKEPVCIGTEILVSPIEFDFVKESQRNEKVVLRSCGNDISDNSDRAMYVRLDEKIPPSVKFSKNKEPQVVLSELAISETLPPSSSQVPGTVGINQRVVPEERHESGAPHKIPRTKHKRRENKKENKVKVKEKGERDNDDGPKAKKRKAVFPKEVPSTSEENEESVNLRDKQEEKRGSAAKKRKFGPIGEPGTSGVSSTSKKRKFQESVDPSDSESSSFETDDSDSKSDGNSNTDTDSDTEEDDFGFLKKKPVKAKQKVSKKTTTKKQKARASSKTKREEKNEKGTCAQTVNNEKGKASKPRDSKKKVKQGKPTRKELMGLGRDIGNKWRILGECLEVEEELDSIDHGDKSLSEKGFQMLIYWTEKNGSSATYRVLSGALEDGLLARKNLSEKYCYG